MGELTREEFERVLAQLAVYDRDTIGVQGAVTQLSTHDAALRQRIAESEKDANTQHQIAFDNLKKVSELEQRLAEVTKERDYWKQYFEEADRGQNKLRGDIRVLQQQLTETREQVRRLSADSQLVEAHLLAQIRDTEDANATLREALEKMAGIIPHQHCVICQRYDCEICQQYAREVWQALKDAAQQAGESKA